MKEASSDRNNNHKQNALLLNLTKLFRRFLKISILLPQHKDHTVWFGISEDGGSSLKLCSSLSRVTLGHGEAVNRHQVGHHQEQLHVSQLGPWADSWSNTIWKKTLLIRDQLSVLKEVFWVKSIGIGKMFWVSVTCWEVCQDKSICREAVASNCGLTDCLVKQSGWGNISKPLYREDRKISLNRSEGKIYFWHKQKRLRLNVSDTSNTTFCTTPSK